MNHTMCFAKARKALRWPICSACSQVPAKGARSPASSTPERLQRSENINAREAFRSTVSSVLKRGAVSAGRTNRQSLFDEHFLPINHEPSMGLAWTRQVAK